MTRDESGQVLAPARIWLCARGARTSPPKAASSARRATLVIEVDPTWLSARRPGDRVSVTDTRGPKRRFGVAMVDPGGVLLEGRHSAYVAAGASLTCRDDEVVACGIPQISRRLTLTTGDRLILTGNDTAVDPPGPGAVARIGCALAEAIPALRAGDPVLFDDGTIAAVVESVDDGEATLRVTRTRPGGQKLGAAKGINLPDTVLPVPALTADDEACLPFVAAHADLVAISFVRTAADIDHVLERMQEAGAADLGLLLKIETRQGFENLPSILMTAMRHPRLGVMIARGDLAVEVGFERLAEIPGQILALCEAAHVPAIWATQVLDTLARTGQPSRAEITDAAAAQRAECVMLNKGPHILDAIHTLDEILVRMGEVQRKSRTLMRHIHSWDVRP